MWGQAQTHCLLSSLPVSDYSHATNTLTNTFMLTHTPIMITSLTRRHGKTDRTHTLYGWEPDSYGRDSSVTFQHINSVKRAEQ